MYKNQLQELAQRSCFNLPSYTCIREGPDHAPRFKASVNFNGEIFEAPTYCTTLRQAEHAAAEVALTALSTRGPSRFLASKVLDEIGVYKNLLQESVHRAGLNLPVYATERSGPGHLPVFISIVELAGMNFTGEPARTKKQAEKNAAMAAWTALKQLANVGSTSQTNNEFENTEEHVVVARVLSTFSPKGENKNLRQRDQNRKTMVSSYRDNYFGSSSKAFLQHHQWKNQHKGSLSTLPTPSPPTYSKILPPITSSTKGAQEQVRSNSQSRSQEIKPPLEEHQKDEDEWLNERSIEKSSNSYSIFMPKPTTQHRPYNQSCPSMLMRRMPYGGIGPASNIAGHGHGGIAPAVNIRSVIPVCAAPPVRPPSSNTCSIAAPPQKKQDLSLASDSSVVKETEQEVPEASSRLQGLHLSTEPIHKSCF